MTTYPGGLIQGVPLFNAANRRFVTQSNATTKAPGRCECCDHPLQHAIGRAVNAYENGVPAGTVLRELHETLQQWEAEQ